MSEADVQWLEKLIEDFEEVFAFPPGFVAFGQEEDASQMDVARTSIRKAERIAVHMKNKDMIENRYILKYLNRLSDLIFLLACFEEKTDIERRRIGRVLFSFKWSDTMFRRWMIFLGSIIMALVMAIILLLLFHKPAPEINPGLEHMKQMEFMHQRTGK